MITTDYMFRSISNTNQRPAAQVEFDATYGIFYAGLWGSNTFFGDGIEIDYYAGITPKWKNITFNFGGLEYTYPGAEDINYFEAAPRRGVVDWRRVDPCGIKDYLVAG